jgi:hypothetical protein
MLGREPLADLDVLDDANAWTYWSRSDAFTMALNMSTNPKARGGLARVIEVWLAHLLHLDVAVEPLASIEDPDWRWFVGLDPEATRLGNAVWKGETLSDDARARLLALFRLTLHDQSRALPSVAGFPIYLLLAATPDRRLALKPHNLIAGLPLADAGRLG